MNTQKSEIKKKLNQFQISPKIVPADEYSIITVNYRAKQIVFGKDQEYRIIYKPVCYYGGEYSNDKTSREFTLYPVEGVLKFNWYFAEEQEHIFIIKKVVGDQLSQIGILSVYSLKNDLINKKPFKGDLHVHTQESNNKESPAYFGAFGRKVGLDFIAITDHRCYSSSVEARRDLAKLPVNYLIVEGEEIHPPGINSHIINFGGNTSISKLIKNQKKFKKEINKLQNKYLVPKKINKYEYACFVWVCEQINKVGGLAVFCHPYWLENDQHYISDDFSTYLLKKKPFDAFEVFNSSLSPESNIIQIAEYYNQLASNNGEDFLPLLGVSDTHNIEDLGSAYTIVFSEKLSKNCLIKNIKKSYSVAVENLSEGDIRIYGQARLIRYAYFLEREVFSEHDNQCFEEGELMIQFLRGDISIKSFQEFKKLI